MALYTTTPCALPQILLSLSWSKMASRASTASGSASELHHQTVGTPSMEIVNTSWSITSSYIKSGLPGHSIPLSRGASSRVLVVPTSSDLPSHTIRSPNHPRARTPPQPATCPAVQKFWNAAIRTCPLFFTFESLVRRSTLTYLAFLFTCEERQNETSKSVNLGKIAAGPCLSIAQPTQPRPRTRRGTWKQKQATARAWILTSVVTVEIEKDDAPLFVLL